MEAQTKAAAFFVIVMLLLSALLIAAFIKSLENEDKQQAQECGTEVMTCPDGTNLTKTLINCNYPKCP